MPDRPSGTVTFLFTDVEGSTGLLKQLRDRYGEVLAEHRRILRDAFASRGGQEVDTQGDAFFYVFSRARDAADAAAAAQRALHAHAWPEDLELRVRIGLHTGEPVVSEEGHYHGLGVHRTARIMAAGHGGQILASQATASVLGDDEPPGIRLRDLGEHQLKDLDRPERIYQLDVDGLPHAFPPLQAEVTKGAGGPVWRAEFWTRRRLVLGGAGALAAAAVASVLALVLGGTAQALSQVDANALGVINPATGKISKEVRVGATPTQIAVGEGAVWVTNADDHTVSRIDPLKGIVVQTIAVGSSPSGITTGNGAVWVANSLDGTVSRIDPRTNTVVQTIDVGNGPVGIAYAAGSVWVANTGDDTITRIDADSGIPAKKPLLIAATDLAVGGGTLWASQRTANRVVRIDPKSGSLVQPIPVGNGPTGIGFGSGAAWVANSLDGTVSRIDPETNSVGATIPAGNGPAAVAVDLRGVWVSNQYDGTLVRIDLRTNQVARRIRIGNRPQGVAVSRGDVLVSVRQSGTGHRGGTLTVRMAAGNFDSIDTAVAYSTASWPFMRMTNDGLVAFNQASGLAGTQLVPDLAVSLPAPTDGGKTYTFQLRPNIRYSSGRPVKASDFRSAFERDFKVAKLSVPYYNGIVGADRCRKRPKRCDISRGIVADDGANTVTFRLVTPDPEFPYKLALPFAFVVPAGTTPKDVGTHPLPATGPYMIASYRPQRSLRLVRNPHFHEWSQAAQPDGYPDQIVVKMGGTPDAAMEDVIRGRADAFGTNQSGTPSEGRLAAIKTRYTSQVHTNPQQGTFALFLNARVAPFDRLDVRRALNYAADRAGAVEAAGGPDLAQATCQILPPHFPGYRPYCPYTARTAAKGVWTAPDLAKARALVAASGTRGMKITVWSYAPFGGFGPYAVKLLRSLGYRASMKVLGDTYFSVAYNSRTKAQIGTYTWISDYPAASGFFNAVLSCASYVPNSSVNQNAAAFCDPRLDRQIEQALTEQVTNPDAARGLWERIDKQTVDQAPWVPLVNPKAVDVLSKRGGNYQYSPAWGMLIDQLWVR